ncbi:auxin-responsive protein SAUR78 [Cocos nucifera]|uniref:Auxin-responsive protein SAUR78 n=1 Tax=Cocos nucifera TaxID=13894 RepID=A0A8K0I265_COCNU|nr:auxin-responsive protein SAUR78 [Cocos nucifera]
MPSPANSIAGSGPIGCCVFLRWPSSSSRLGYRTLPPVDGYNEDEDSTVRVVVGKERRVFLVDPFVLDMDPFRVLLEMVRKERKGRESKRKDAIFVDIDAILFEHMLWLVYNDFSSSSASMLQLNLKEIIEFYSQDN